VEDSQKEPQSLQPRDWLTPGEVAALLRVSEDALLRAARRGAVPCLRVGREFRFFQAALVEAAVTPITKTTAAAPGGAAPREPAPPPHPVRPGAGLSHRASEAAGKRAETSRQAIKACGELAASFADQRRRDAERAPQDNVRAWRWVAHHRPDLEAIALRHALDFEEFVPQVHRRVRRKRVELAENVVAELDQLIERHSLYDAWSVEPPSEAFPTTVTVAIRSDEEASFTHNVRTKELWLTPRDLTARVDRVGEVASASASAELRLGDIVSANVARMVDRRENARRLADWERRGANPDRLPNLLPSRTTWFLRLTPTDVIEVPFDHPGRHALTSYLVGSGSLAEVLADLGREDAIPDWLTLPGVPHWWRFPDSDSDVSANDDTERLESSLRALASLGRIFAEHDERRALEFDRIELALTQSEASEIRRLAVDEGQADAAIGRAFRTVWDEFVAEPSVRATTDDDIGKRLCAVVAAHFGEDVTAAPWKRPGAPVTQKRSRHQPFAALGLDEGKGLLQNGE